MSEQPANPTVPSETVPSEPASATVVPVPAVEELIDINHFAKVKLRVGQIEAAELVPKSKKLLKLQVNLGPTLGKRQILSGIAQFHTPESLIGRKIVVIVNLAPAKMMGIESQGMLLAASNDEHTALTLLDPGQEMPLGATVR